MLEDYLAFYLQKYLGKYVKGLSKEALKISAWQGNVELKNMELKPEALVELKLPVKVKAGFLGSVKLKLPWSRLGKEPVVVELDRIFVLAEPSFKVEGADDTAVQEARYQAIKEAEIAAVNALGDQMQQQQPGLSNSWMGSLAATIISNLKLSFTNIHIRYEDADSNPGHPFTFGVTLEKLAAVTVDENGNEIFVSGGAVDRINKSGELKRLAVYFDSNSDPWSLNWETMRPADWSRVFEPGIKAEVGKTERHFVLQPVDGMAKYKRLGTREERNADEPAQIATAILENVTLCLSELQYKDVLKLVDNVSAFTTRVQYAHYRPQVSIRHNPKAWWQYAIKATSEQIRRSSGRLKWEKVLQYTRLRKQYVSLYAKRLVENLGRTSINDDGEIRQLDAEVDKDVVVHWRVIAHTIANQAKAQTEEREKEQQSKRSWWLLGWGGQSQSDDRTPRSLSEEDWKQLNEAIGYEEGKTSTLLPGQDAPTVLHTVLEVKMHYNASKLLSANGEEILDLSCEVLQSSVELYSVSKRINVKLEAYKIRSPDGILVESAEQLDALDATFCYEPMVEDLDWSLSAKASPCYITYYQSSIDRVTKFFRNRSAVSREVAIQTAAVLQMTLDDVARKTQQQLNEAMRNKPRFSLMLDIAAPKVTVPTSFCPKPSRNTQLMVDLGHLTMRTETAEEQGLSGEAKELYICFKMELNDVSAFLVDGSCGWDIVNSSEQDVGILPVLERCGVVAAIQQIYAPHPLYPNTRLAVRLPYLGVDFSPARYHRLMEVVKVFQSTSVDDAVRPWVPADAEGNLQVLSWKGIGNREAVWKRRFGALAGPFLYILDSASAEEYEHCVSLISKQVYAVPPEVVGGVNYVLAVCDPDQFGKKVVESVSALVLRFEDEKSFNYWKSHLSVAINKIANSQAASRALSVKQTEEESLSNEKELFLLTGALDELKLRISCTKTKMNPESILLGEEALLLELRALRSKVDFLLRKNDMGIGAALLSLDVEDKWHGHTSSSCRYLARSTMELGEEEELKSLDHRRSSGSERFFDTAASLDFDGEREHHLTRKSSSQFYDADSSFDTAEQGPPSLNMPSGLLPKLEQSILLHKDDKSLKNFIKAQAILTSTEASYYDNVDKQVKISLSTLAFFLNRPTLVALLDFVTGINTDVEPQNQTSKSGEPKEVVSVITPADVRQNGSVPVFDRKDSVVKGLLGTGKSRVLFLLALEMDHAQIVLNRDEGTRFATLSQENLQVVIKIFPASYAIHGSLGNLRIGDDSLAKEHPYYRLCDMRDLAGKSFVELSFVSYNEDDDDYEGYEFSLSGKLSEIRVVYLHRFIQEVSEYFLGLVPAENDYVVKLKDKVTDAEKNFTQSQVQGAPALKLNLSLTKPVIIFPRSTNSNSFLELDVLQIEVSNTFQWLGGGKEDIDSVRLETDILKVEDIHLVVAVNGETGQNIIKESSGVFVLVRRTLRDLQHRLPAVDAAIELKTLRAALSDQEYHVILDCSLENLSERPNLPPRLAISETAGAAMPEHTSSDDDLSQDENDRSEIYSWTTLKLTVDVTLVQLQLFAGAMKDTPLASVQVSRVWAAYKMSTDEEKYVMLSLDAVNVSDDRAGIEPELRFMIGKVDESDSCQDQSADIPRLIMLVLDARLTPTSQMVTLRLQRPRVLLALDFLLAVAEFFIPSVADMIPSAKEIVEQPHDMKKWQYLEKTSYFQEAEEVIFSPKHVLVADDEDIDKYVYDGRGGRIHLRNAAEDDVPDPSEGPLIIVGHGKSLRFRNVVIKDADCLKSCISLGSNSSYSISERDGVYLVFQDTDALDSHQKAKASEKKNGAQSIETTFDLQAIGPELLIYSASLHSSQVKDRLLCAKLDAFSRIVLKGDDLELNGEVNGLFVEGGRGLCVLEPVDASFRYSKVSSKQNVHLSVSEVVCNLTFTTLQLLLKLQEDVQSFLLLTSKTITVECTQFDKIWAGEDDSGSSRIAFWRPRVPPGFAALGDCLTVVDEPPSRGVLALNMNLAHVRKPEGFDLVWSSRDRGEVCSVWLPIAPVGYVTTGCIASLGNDPPDPNSVLCIAKHLVTKWFMKDCINVTERRDFPWIFWRCNNSIGSFLHASAVGPPKRCQPYELRHVAIRHEKQVNDTVVENNPAEDKGEITADDENKLCLMTTTRFKRVWWNKGSKSSRTVSIWRAAQGVFFGDFAVEGYEPPGLAFLPVDMDNGLLQKPVEFNEIGSIRETKGLKSVSFWCPVAPTGYVSLGCLASRGALDPDTAGRFRCLRADLVKQATFPPLSLWDSREIKKSHKDISLWPLQVVDSETKASTFLVSTTLDPPTQLAFELSDVGNTSESDGIVGDAEVRKISVTLFDDFSGLMVPLAKVSVDGITTSLHGTFDALRSTTNFSLEAGTYNGRCEAWEPLIEQTEGYLRYSSESMAVLSSSLSEISLAAIKDLNLNISASNLNLLLGAYESWTKLQNIEMSMQEKGIRKDAAKPILEHEHEKKLQVSCHNDIGQQLFCRLLDERWDVKVVPVLPGQTQTFRIPSMISLRDPMTRNATKQRSAAHISLKIGSAEFPRDDGLEGRQYMVSVRVVPVMQNADQHQLQYQSARTRCVNPSHDEDDLVTVIWNELFVFELEVRQHGYTVKLLLSDLSKGIAAGYCSVPLHDYSKLGGRPWNDPLMEMHPIYVMNSEEVLGRMSVGCAYIPVANAEEDLTGSKPADLEAGSIYAALSTDGPWTKLYLNLASKCSYINLGGEPAVGELKMEGGTKHLTIRSPVMLTNKTIMQMEASLFPQSGARKDGVEAVSGMSSFEEEVFENERYQPLAGWGSSWPGHLLPTDPGRWSKRDLTCSCQEFPNVELPLGWEWSSDWYVDGASTLDEDGWAYAFSFKNLTEYPFESSRGKMSFVRRRRWVRVRRRTSFIENARCLLGVLDPESSTAMPIACFRETRQDYLLQLQPKVNDGGEQCGWTRVALSQGRGQKKLPVQEINVRALLDNQRLTSCLLEAPGSKSLWFCLDVNFAVIGRDVHAGLIKDCQLLVSAPLKIINHLPMAAQYSVYYASRIRGYKLQAQAVVESGETADIYAADIRKALFLSFIPQGPWLPDQDPVMISHPFRDVDKHMIVHNTSTKRDVRLRIEYGGEDEVATSKVLRISVPFWIDCKRCPPIRLRFIDMEHERRPKCLPDLGSSVVVEDILHQELQESFTMLSDFTPSASGLSASLLVDNSEAFGPVSPSADLDKVDGTIELTASDGRSYFRLLVSTTLCPLKFAHTKVITFRPYITFTNRFGSTLYLKQCNSDDPRLLSPSDSKVAFCVATVEHPPGLQIRMESSQWSDAIRVVSEDTIYTFLPGDEGKKHFVRLKIRGYLEGSRFSVVIQRGSFRGPYRLENRTARKTLKFRQAGTTDDDWELVYPSSTRSFAWKNPSGNRTLELLSDKMTDVIECNPAAPTEIRASGLSVRVIQLHEVKLVKVTDDDHQAETVPRRKKPSSLSMINQFKFVLDVGKLGVSIIDQRPQEILFCAVENSKFSVLYRSQENISRLKIRVGNLQLDDQNLLTSFPVVFAPEIREVPTEDCVFRSTFVMLVSNDDAAKVYPHIGIWVTERAWCVSIHEPIIWTVLDMYRSLHLDVISGGSEVVGIDPEIRINLMDASGARLKLTLKTEPSQRPRGVLGIWSPLFSLLGNTSKMPVHITGTTLENRYMRQSEVSNALINHLRKDLFHQAFMVLLGVNVFGMASSTLETLSKTAADLSRDEEFRQLRTTQDRVRHLSGVGDGLLRGGEALARGLAFGLSGVVTKPVTNARESGVSGFLQGVGKAFVGFVMQPISGVLDFIALTIDGVNMSYIRCFDAFSQDRMLARMRLPRAIRADGVISEYDERAALGQAMMQLAEGSSFGQNVVFKEPAKFALSDFYEDHFELPEGKAVVITNHRVMLLIQPSSYRTRRNVAPSNPCKIVWEVAFIELLSVEVAKRTGGRLPAYVVLHLRNDAKTFAQVIKCSEENHQAERVLSSIETRWRKYGPGRRSLVTQTRKWQHAKSLPTPRVSKRIQLSEDRRSNREVEGGSEPFVREVLQFEQIWKSEQESSLCCTSFTDPEPNPGCTIWRPVVDDGYVSVGDVAYAGTSSPTVTLSYKNTGRMFAQPSGFFLVWRNWRDAHEPVSIWKPRAPEGYTAVGCVAVAGYAEPEVKRVWCVRSDAVEAAEVSDSLVWEGKRPWACYLYHLHSHAALTFTALREPKPADFAAYTPSTLPHRMEEERAA